jgi:hypothetical protein
MARQVCVACSLTLSLEYANQQEAWNVLDDELVEV